MRIPLNIGVKGRVTATLTNTETGEKQEVRGDNLILNDYLNRAMTSGLGLLGTHTFDRCYVGDGDTLPQPGDMGLSGSQLAMSSSSELISDVTNVSFKLNEVLKIEAFGVGNQEQLALTPDGEILLVGGEGDYPILRAYLVDDLLNNSNPQPLNISSFEELEGHTACVGLSCGGDYLFVGLNEYPYGKLFKRVDNDFIFMGDVPNNITRGVSYSRLNHRGDLLVIKLHDSNRCHFVEIDSSGNMTHLYYADISGFGGMDFLPDGNNICYSHGSSSDYLIRVSVRNIQNNNIIYSQEVYSRISTTISGLAVNSNFDILGFGNDPDATIWQRYFYIPYTGNYTWGNPTHAELGRTSLLNLRTMSNIFISSGGDAISSSNLIPYLGLGRIATTSSTFGSMAIDESKNLIFLRLSDTTPSALGVFNLRKIHKKNISYSRKWTFPAGVGTGTVREVALRSNSTAALPNGNSTWVARIVLPEPLEKTNLHQLDVIWEIEMENPGVWEGVIPGGSRDGSDLAWRVTINEEQFFALVSTGYSIPANWFGVTGTPNVRIGTSNEESDLIFDRGNIKGEEIEYISSTALSIVNPYVPGSLKRTIRLFLEVNQGNGQIGEIVLGGSTSSNSLARITFDPPLDKPPDVGEGANPYRIYLDLEIGWQRGE